MDSGVMNKIKRSTLKVTCGIQDSMDVSKLHSKIKREEFRMEEIYKNIGMLFCDNQPEEIPEIIQKQVDAIETCKSEIALLKDEIERIKGVSFCSKCGCEVLKDMKFCSQCGEKLHD